MENGVCSKIPISSTMQSVSFVPQIPILCEERSVIFWEVCLENKSDQRVEGVVVTLFRISSAHAPHKSQDLAKPISYASSIDRPAWESHLMECSSLSMATFDDIVVLVFSKSSHHPHDKE